MLSWFGEALRFFGRLFRPRQRAAGDAKARSKVCLCSAAGNKAAAGRLELRRIRRDRRRPHGTRFFFGPSPRFLGG